MRYQDAGAVVREQVADGLMALSVTFPGLRLVGSWSALEGHVWVRSDGPAVSLSDVDLITAKAITLPERNAICNAFLGFAKRTDVTLGKVSVRPEQDFEHLPHDARLAKLPEIRTSKSSFILFWSSVHVIEAYLLALRVCDLRVMSAVIDYAVAKFALLTTRNIGMLKGDLVSTYSDAVSYARISLGQDLSECMNIKVGVTSSLANRRHTLDCVSELISAELGHADPRTKGVVDAFSGLSIDDSSSVNRILALAGSLAYSPATVRVMQLERTKLHAQRQWYGR